MSDEDELTPSDIRWICTSLLRTARTTTPFGDTQEMVDIFDHNRSHVCYTIIKKLVNTHGAQLETGDTLAETAVLSSCS